MNKQKQHGFTVVELAVVITVIAILAAIVMLSYRQVQHASRDDIRKSDITLLRSALDSFYTKNGLYPPGCPTDGACAAAFDGNTSAAFIRPASTISSLKQALPNLPTEFGDPLSSSGATPFFDASTTTTPKKYIYYGGAYLTRPFYIASYSANPSAAHRTWSENFPGFPCTINVHVSATQGRDNQTSSYIVGYYSESESKWKIYGGKYGKPLTLTGTAANGCVILP